MGEASRRELPCVRERRRRVEGLPRECDDPALKPVTSAGHWEAMYQRTGGLVNSILWKKYLAKQPRMNSRID